MLDHPVVKNILTMLEHQERISSLKKFSFACNQNYGLHAFTKIRFSSSKTAVRIFSFRNHDKAGKDSSFKRHNISSRASRQCNELARC